MNIIRSKLFEHSDLKYKQFNASLLPTVDENTIIGVRAPKLRGIAKWLEKSEYVQEFLALEHEFYEENILHAYIINEVKDYDKCVLVLDAFLPCVDNWAVCDALNPKALSGEKLIDDIKRWISSTHAFTVRFGIGMLMRRFLDKDFKEEYLDLVASINSNEYYVKMMVAWFFATALSKQYQATLPYLKEQRLPKWTHNKAIQKAIESRVISQSIKQDLRGLKVK